MPARPKKKEKKEQHRRAFRKSHPLRFRERCPGKRDIALRLLEDQKQKKLSSFLLSVQKKRKKRKERRERKERRRTRPLKPTFSIFQKKQLNNIENVRLPPILPLNSPLHPLIFAQILIAMSRFGLQATNISNQTKKSFYGLNFALLGCFSILTAFVFCVRYMSERKKATKKPTKAYRPDWRHNRL